MTDVSESLKYHGWSYTLLYSSVYRLSDGFFSPLRHASGELQEKISLAEEESNDLDKIEAEKRKFDALQDWSKKPRYQMPETLLERAKRWIRDVFFDTCDCGGTYYDWSASKSVCDKCGRVK